MLYPHPPATNHPATPLNAIAPHPPESAADRTERQLRACRELTELGMQVARAAAREAVATLETPIEHPMPGAHLPPVCRIADPGRLFTRVAYAVRQAIALENRIVAGDFTPLRNAQPQQRTPGPPHAKTAARPAAQSGLHPETPESFHQEGFEALDHRPVEQILAAIRQALGQAPDQAAAHPPLRPVRPAPPASRPAPQPESRRPAPQPPPRPG